MLAEAATEEVSAVVTDCAEDENPPVRRKRQRCSAGTTAPYDTFLTYRASEKRLGRKLDTQTNDWAGRLLAQEPHCRSHDSRESQG